MKLTNLKVKNAKPKQKNYKLRDGKGLYLFVMTSGSKSWRYDYKIKVDSEKYKNGTFVYGSFPEISLSEVRILHGETKKIISQGIDPNDRKKELERQKLLSNADTFKKIAGDWLEKKRQEVKPKTLEDIRKRLEKYVFPVIGNIPLNKLSAQDILEMLKNLENRGAYDLLYRLRQYCGQILRYAVAHQKIERDFTVDLVEAFPTRSIKHQPALESHEIPEFLKALRNNDARLYVQTRLALKMLMLTFVRPIELVSAEWSEFDFEDNRWIIRATKMKMKKDHIVPLFSQTLKILNQMKQVTGDGQYVFPKQTKPKEHMARDTLSKAVRSLGFQGRHTPHGFRALARTTIREKLDWDSEIIERQLAHLPNTSLGNTYDRTQFLDKRIIMMQEWGDYIEQIENGTL